MATSKFKANWDVDQTPGKSIEISVVELLCHVYVDGTHLCVPFPFYARNTNYTVTSTNITISDVGYASLSRVLDRKKNCVALLYNKTGNSINRAYAGSITITFA